MHRFRYPASLVAASDRRGKSVLGRSKVEPYLDSGFAFGALVFFVADVAPAAVEGEGVLVVVAMVRIELSDETGDWFVRRRECERGFAGVKERTGVVRVCR